MKRRKLIISTVIALIVCGAAVFLTCIRQDDNAKIRRVIFKFVRLAEKPDHASAAELAVKLRTLQTVFCDEVTLDIRHPAISEKYSPRSLEPLLVRYRKHFNHADASLSDLEINISGERADALFSVHLTGVTLRRHRVDEVRDVNCTLIRADGAWRIEKVSITNVLER